MLMLFTTTSISGKRLENKPTYHGIIIQEITSQNNDDNNGETTVIKTTQRSPKVPDIMLKPYSIGVKKTSIFNIPNSIKHYGENAITKLSLKTDLAYVLVKMLNDCEESPLPGWTGFNIMLYKAKIPKESRIGYLPVINNLPTEYSNINAILENGVNIANALQLDSIMMVFDEAVLFEGAASEMEKRAILQQADCVLRRVSYNYVPPVGNIKTI